jgi:hypothetical protein
MIRRPKTVLIRPDRFVQQHHETITITNNTNKRTRVCANHRMIYDAIQPHSMIDRPVHHSSVVDGVRNHEKRQRDRTRMYHHRSFFGSTTGTTKKFARQPTRQDDDESNGGYKSPPPLSKRVAEGHATSWFLGWYDDGRQTSGLTRE